MALVLFLKSLVLKSLVLIVFSILNFLLSFWPIKEKPEDTNNTPKAYGNCKNTRGSAFGLSRNLEDQLSTEVKERDADEKHHTHTIQCSA